MVLIERRFKRVSLRDNPFLKVGKVEIAPLTGVEAVSIRKRIRRRVI